MIKIIRSVELKQANDEMSEFRKLPMIPPFGKLKVVTSREDAGELSTITLTATLRSDASFIHEPSIVRITWKGGSCVLGSPDIPAMFTLTEEDIIVATCSYQSSTRIFET